MNLVGDEIHFELQDSGYIHILLDEVLEIFMYYGLTSVGSIHVLYSCLTGTFEYTKNEKWEVVWANVLQLRSLILG